MSTLVSRKADHLRINRDEDVQSGQTTGLENFRFIHQALPDINLDQIETGINIFKKHLQIPLLISSMTGGTDEAMLINQNLALAAQAKGVALGVGSQRAALEHSEQVYTFEVRKFAPDILLFANLGAIQLNRGYSLIHCQRAVDMIQADALILHLNPLQEALQKEGDVQFSGLLKKIETICRNLPVPVIAKEVGWGISGDTALKLLNAGISAIDVAGAGGTSWSQVEMYRHTDELQKRVASVFRDWGIPTSESVKMVHAAAPDLIIFASGGLRNGVEIAKCIAMGACLGGIAGPFLKAAMKSVEEVVNLIEEIYQELKICMFSTGTKNLENLQTTPIFNIHTGELCH